MREKGERLHPDLNELPLIRLNDSKYATCLLKIEIGNVIVWHIFRDSENEL